MLRLGLVLLAGVVACDAEGRWPGARDGEGPPIDDFPDAGISFSDAASLPDGGVINGSNIVVNGGFERMREDGSFATRWLPEAVSPGGTISIVEAPTYTGQRALEFDVAAAAGEGVEFSVVEDGLSAERLVAGGTYELAGFYRINQTGGGSINFNYILRSNGGDPDIGNEWDDNHPAAVDTWEEFAWQFTIPDDYAAESYSLYLHFIKFSNLRIVLQVDEVSLVRIQ